MKDLSRVEQNEKGYYIEYPNSKCVRRYYGQIREHCPVCNEPFFATNTDIRRGKGNFCSYFCSNKNGGFQDGHVSWNKGKEYFQIKGKNHPSWKGGKHEDGRGYVLVYKPKHPFHNNHNYVYEHRLVTEKHLGRYLRPEEIVHHVDGNRHNNKIENLKLFKNNGEHSKIHVRMNGKNHPNWRGGVSKDHYLAEFWRLRKIAKERDNWTCQLCGSVDAKKNGKLCAHHIDYNKKNLDLLNLITLCKKCNSKVNFNREYWKEYFQNLRKGGE